MSSSALPHIVKLQGGLGNQMFQYAFGMALQHCSTRAVVYDMTFFEQGEGEHVSRRSELHVFGITPERAREEQIDSLLDERSPWRSRLARRIPGMVPPTTLREGQPYTFRPELLDSLRAQYFDGYWQTARYFGSIEKEVRKAFTFLPHHDPKVIRDAETMAATEAVSLHVRRGDYTSHPEAQRYFVTCGLDYYQRGMERMLERSPRSEFFVFSDDPAWAREHLPNLAPMHFVEGNSGDKSPADMYLMSRCKHHIIANSSFSWWGAWLGNSPEKLVIAPQRWLRDPAIPTPDLLPQQWIRC